MRPGLFPAAVTVTSLLATACGSSAATADGQGGSCTSATSFPVAPITTVTSDSGKLAIAVRTAPYQPLVAGLDCVELVVTSPSTDAGVDGLTVTMTPWMPAMGHGADTTPAVTPLGQGRYVLTGLSLFMAGEWQLRTQFSGPVIDSVEPTFSVE